MSESVDGNATAIVARDDYSCVNCESAVDDDTPATDAVWDLSGREIDDATVTVCAGCGALLRERPPDWRRQLETAPAEAVIGFLRAVTKTQGAVVADVAALSAEATGGLDDDARRRYLEDRRRICLRLAVVDRHLAAACAPAVEQTESVPDSRTDPSTSGDSSVSSGSTPSLPPDAVEEFEAVRAQGRTLQDQLRAVLSLVEMAVAAAGTCHVCLESRSGPEPCPSCATPARDDSAWRADDGSLDAPSLYGAITDRLETASATTTRLTNLSESLAETLFE